MTQSKEENSPTETIPEKDQVANLLDKDFKTTILTMLKELKDMEKVKKIIYLYKETENLKETKKKS